MCLTTTGFKFLRGKSGTAYKVVSHSVIDPKMRGLIYDTTIWEIGVVKEVVDPPLVQAYNAERVNSKEITAPFKPDYYVPSPFYKAGFHLYKTLDIAVRTIPGWIQPGEILVILEVEYERAIAEDHEQIVAKKVTPTKILSSYTIYNDHLSRIDGANFVNITEHKWSALYTYSD